MTVADDRRADEAFAKQCRKELKKARKKGLRFFDRHPLFDAFCSMEPYAYQRQRRIRDYKLIEYHLRDLEEEGKL